MSNASAKIEIICSKCGSIPEILKIHTDNGEIEFNCKNCGKNEQLIDDFIDELSSQKYFKKCEDCIRKDVETNYYYCIDCKKDICENCKMNEHSGHYCIESQKKKTICLQHNQEFKYFCYDCKENICEEEMKIMNEMDKMNKKYKHKEHEIKEIAKMKESKSLINNREKIKKINQDLKNLIEFNNLLLDKAEILKNKDFYKNSIKNMGTSLEEGNNRNSKDMTTLLHRLSKDIGNSFKANKKLKEKDIRLKRDEKYLHLNNRELDDNDFKHISQISFNQLKEIDLSDNKIKSIQPFKKMSLPFLEFLNLSYNSIEIIEPVARLKSKYLQYIFLQGNKIEDIKVFFEPEFPRLKILRIEDGYNKQKEETMEKIKELDNYFSGKFIYKPIDKQIEEFKNKFKIEISENINKIDLSNKHGGNEMLKKLFLIITYKPKNKINNLILRNNDIKDPSMLKWINFNKLKILDLSVNKIKNLTFLLDMKAENLEKLYLDNNEFEEIYQILHSKLPKLKVLSLNKNDFEPDEMKDNPIFKKLKQKNVKIEGKEKENENNESQENNISNGNDENNINNENNENNIYIQLKEDKNFGLKNS